MNERGKPRAGDIGLRPPPPTDPSSDSGPADGNRLRSWSARALAPPRLRPPRLLLYLATVWTLVTLNFFLPRAMPGDPISAMLADGGGATTLDDAARAKVAAYYGLDRPLHVQYGHYLASLASGDLGTSIRHNRRVAAMLGERLPWTLLLGVTAVALPTAVGLVAGVNSGWRRGRRVDSALLALFTGLRGIPPFFLGSLLLFVFAVELRWFPLSGATTPFSDASAVVGRVADVAHHLVLPAVTMAVLYATAPYLLMRAGMVSELGADYLVLGRAKGLRERRLKYGYAARNALLPLVSLTAVELGAVAGGVIFVETVFAYPGVGRLIFESVAARDYPALQGAFLVVTVFVVTVNALADAAYARLDPRVKG